jgi:transposase-like protein
VVASDRMALLELLSKAGLSGDADASQRIGAEPYERSVQRQTHRNGYRERRTERALLSVVQEACRHRSPGVPGTPLGSSGDLPLA